MFTYQLNYFAMKTISNANVKFPKPFKFAMYLLLVSALCFLNYISLSANDPAHNKVNGLEIRLAEALEPAADPEYELEGWILTFTSKFNEEGKETKNSLETRLTEALKPVADPEPELDDWLLTFSEDLMEESGE